MSLPKFVYAIAGIVLCLVAFFFLFRGSSEPDPSSEAAPNIPIEIVLDEEVQTLAPASENTPKTEVSSQPIELPEANRIEEFFNKGEPKLPIVETITYKSHVSWQKGRPAWLSDYASHYNTSRHFIARSLNGKPDYLKQEVKEGDRFNVLRKDKNYEFYLLVDSSRCKMWFYYIDLDTKEKVLVKTYSVGLGRVDSSKASGLLTPLGTYSLGSKTAVYKPKLMSTYQGKKIEMITVFGTRWIPFDKEISNCTEPSKGLGLHGTPWANGPDGVLVDQENGIGKYESDGCIRLATPDIEEIFAIIITKPTTIEIVRDFMERQ